MDNCSDSAVPPGLKCEGQFNGEASKDQVEWSHS